MGIAVEVALCTLVTIWTLVSLALGVMAFLLVRKVQEAIDRVNALLATGQHVAEDVRAPVQAVAQSFREVFALANPVPPVPGDPVPVV